MVLLLYNIYDLFTIPDSLLYVIKYSFKYHFDGFLVIKAESIHID